MVDAVQTASKIKQFLSVYANIRPDYDPEYDDENERFTSPDASILFAAQQILEKEPQLPNNFAVDSSWESGGYSPYTDAEGRAIHNQLVAECKELIKPA